MKANQMPRRQFLKLSGAILATIPSWLFLAGSMPRPTLPSAPGSNTKARQRATRVVRTACNS